MGGKALKLRWFRKTEKKSLLYKIVVCMVIWLLIGNIALNNDKAAAKDFPEKNITFIIPFAVGGHADLLVRSIAPFLQEQLGVAIQIENVPGIVKTGLTKLWKSKPDGYTIGHFVNASSVIAELSSQTEFKSKEFTHIYAWNVSNTILQVHPSGPKTLTEFVQLAKRQSLSGATGAFGSATHLASVIMAKGLGIEVRWVHYNSGGEANIALAGGHVNFNTVAMSPQTVSLAQAGKLRILIIVADEKDPSVPDIPIPRDFGFSFRTFPFLHGVAGPKNIPSDRVSRLENACAAAIKDPRFKKRAEESKTSIVHLSSEAYRQETAET